MNTVTIELETMLENKHGDLIHKHARRWDPIMATIMKEADDQNVPDDPMARAMFGLKFMAKIMMDHEA